MLSDPVNEPKQAEKTDASAVPEVAPVFAVTLRSFALPVAIFGAAFLLLSILLTVVLSPDRFPVRIGDHSVRLSDLEAEQQSLLAEQAALTKARSAGISDAESPVLHQVERIRADILPVGSVLIAIEEARAGFAVTGADPIALPVLTFSAADGTITLGGSVSDHAGRSAQLLARFVDALRKINHVVSVSEPEYKPSLLPDGGNTAPFTLTITLKHA